VKSYLEKSHRRKRVKVGMKEKKGVTHSKELRRPKASKNVFIIGKGKFKRRNAFAYDCRDKLANLKRHLFSLRMKSLYASVLTEITTKDKSR
jgi:hypothetical protein